MISLPSDIESAQSPRLFTWKEAAGQPGALNGPDCDACVDARMRETHHRIKNDLQLVASMLSLQARQAGDIRLQDQLAQAALRVVAIARLHEKLQIGRLDAVSAQDFLEGLCADLARVMGCRDRGVIIRVAADDAILSGHQASSISMIVNELATNSIKHAFHKKGGVIDVAFADMDGRRTLIVADNGEGMQENAAKAGSGLGLSLVAQFTRGLGGTMVTVGDARGMRVEIRF